MNGATAKIVVQGKTDPTPKGAIANRIIMPPMHHTFKIHPFNSMDIAIKPWHIAIVPTTRGI
ncbi:MAG: hypothetical protein SGI83_16930 [Bacteroidota bacterium]|nr:hypothetical protein [Bacteroidota bacterium]